MFEQAQIQEFKEVGGFGGSDREGFGQGVGCAWHQGCCGEPSPQGAGDRVVPCPPALLLCSQAFTIMDQNRDGFIDKADLRDTFAALGEPPLGTSPPQQL